MRKKPNSPPRQTPPPRTALDDSLCRSTYLDISRPSRWAEEVIALMEGKGWLPPDARETCTATEWYEMVGEAAEKLALQLDCHRLAVRLWALGWTEPPDYVKRMIRQLFGTHLQ